MNAITTRPLKRLTLVVLCATTLSSCAGIQNHSVYKSWEKQAYSAYQLQRPNPAMKGVPAFFRSLPGPVTEQRVWRTAHQAPAKALALTPSHPTPNTPQRILNEEEQRYIAEYYGL